jgi:hypothetical protein
LAFFLEFNHNYLKMQRACLLKDKEMVEFSKPPTSLMTGSVVISDVDALMYVVLSKAGKHVPYE